MPFARPDAGGWTRAAAAAVLLLGSAVLTRLGPRGEAADGGALAEPSAPPQHRWIIGATAALLVAAGLGAGGWWAMQARERAEVARAITGGEPSRGPALMTRYGCGGCHSIPGVPGADGRVAAPLTGMRERVYVGGVVRNTTDDLIRWIVDPRALSPRTAMPATGITEAEARDVAAHLYAQ